MVTPVTDRLKRLAAENGVAASHAAASSFRRGYANAMRRMNRAQMSQDKEQLKKIQSRGGNWVEGSEVTDQRYMYDEDTKGLWRCSTHGRRLDRLAGKARGDRGRGAGVGVLKERSRWGP